MPQRLILKSLVLTGLVALTIACSKDKPLDNPVPVIEFKSVDRFTREAIAGKPKRDSIVTKISFKDGDGDLGENKRDTIGLKQKFANQSWGNYEIRTFQFVNNKFEEIILSSNAKLFVDFGFSGSATSKSPANGVLGYSQNFLYEGNYQMTPVKFRIRIRDRNLNESNVVESDTIRIPIVQ